MEDRREEESPALCFHFSWGEKSKAQSLLKQAVLNLLSECMKDIELKPPRSCMVSLHGELSTK